MNDIFVFCFVYLFCSCRLNRHWIIKLNFVHFSNSQISVHLNQFDFKAFHLEHKISLIWECVSLIVCGSLYYVNSFWCRFICSWNEISLKMLKLQFSNIYDNMDHLYGRCRSLLVFVDLLRKWCEHIDPSIDRGQQKQQEAGIKTTERKRDWKLFFPQI